MKILTAAQMRSADQAAITQHNIPGHVLMERAGAEVVHCLFAQIPLFSSKRVVVVTGKGNNGGDGYVVARLLRQAGVDVVVFALADEEQLSGDARTNAKAWRELGGKSRDVSGMADASPSMENELATCDVVIDAVFGTGFRGQITGAAAEMIKVINTAQRERRAIVVAVDIPSGLEASSAHLPRVHVEASFTITFHALKVAHVLFPAAGACGDVFVADIGIPAELVGLNVEAQLITKEVARSVALKLPHGVAIHKGTRGHVLVVGGSPGHYGAPKLSSHAALRIGAGLVSMALPQSVAERMSVHQKELMCETLSDAGDGSFGRCDEAVVRRVLAGKKALVIGPGLGTAAGSVELLRAVLTLGQGLPQVLDADAINIISAHREFEHLIGPHVILTPHPGEMARLSGKSITEIEDRRLELAREWSNKLNCTIVLKGARTVVANSKSTLCVNPAACAALATAGSGDVLSGIIGGLLSQGLCPGEAAMCGVYLHGEAGVKLYQDYGGRFGIVAGDLSREAPMVLNRLLSSDVVDRPRPGHAVRYLSGAISFNQR